MRNYVILYQPSGTSAFYAVMIKAPDSVGALAEAAARGVVPLAIGTDRTPLYAVKPHMPVEFVEANAFWRLGAV